MAASARPATCWRPRCRLPAPEVVRAVDDAAVPVADANNPGRKRFRAVSATITPSRNLRVDGLAGVGLSSEMIPGATFLLFHGVICETVIGGLCYAILGPGRGRPAVVGLSGRLSIMIAPAHAREVVPQA